MTTNQPNESVSPDTNTTPEITPEQQITDLQDQLLRLQAEFQNFRRRQEELLVTSKENFSQSLFLSLLPLHESLIRSKEHQPEELKDHPWAQGVSAICAQMDDFLQTRNIKRGNSLGEIFDPKKHEALLMVAGPKDTVLQVFEEAYFIGEKTLRFAKVQVGNGDKA